MGVYQLSGKKKNLGQIVTQSVTFFFLHYSYSVTFFYTTASFAVLATARQTPHTHTRCSASLC